MFLVDQVRRLVERRPELAHEEPFATLLTGDLEFIRRLGKKFFADLTFSTLAGVPEERLEAEARDFIRTARHPVFDVPLGEVAYQPMKELIALVRAKPNTINYGSSGIGCTGHLAGELMSLMGGLVMTHVPYKGGAPAVADLIGGNIPMVITVVPGAMPQVRANRARLLAVTTGKRSALLPDTPTIAESGLPGFEANNWYGVVVPAKTPQSIVMRLNTELVKVLNSAGLRETYANQGIEAIPSTPAEFTAYIRSEIVKWGKIVKAAGIKAD
jgi:tripartite-type tricarboxylate transporter receptor subunit TctC